MKYLVTLSLIIFFGAGICFGDVKLRSEHISLEEGVPNNLIFSIMQDSKGFLWFGTMFGLVRYDGITYKTYRHNPNDTNSLSNDDVTSIFEDKDGDLWIGTYNGGLNKYNRQTGKFTRYLHQDGNPNSISSNTVWDFVQDETGTIWFATIGGGLCKFKDGIFTAFVHNKNNPGSISTNNLQAIARDKKGIIWIASPAGLNKFDPKNDSFTIFTHDENDSNTISNNFIVSIFIDDQNNVWAGTNGGGLNRYDEDKNKFIKYIHNPDDSLSINSNFVQEIGKDSEGVLLVGTGKGLSKLDIASGKFEKLDTGPDNKIESVIDFVKDRSGVIWVSSYLNGLYKVYYENEKFNSLLPGKNATCVIEDSRNRIWIGTRSEGLFISENGGIDFKNILSDKNSKVNLSGAVINSITEDKNKNIWIGSSKGLIKFNDHNSPQLYVNERGNNSSLSGNNVERVYCDKEGIVWAGTGNGLSKYSEATNDFKVYRRKPGDPNSLLENTILSIYEDNNNFLWVGTFGGLNRINKANETFKHYSNDPYDNKSISNNYVFSFCADPFGNFWIGTGGGLNLFDYKTETFVHFDVKEGLPNGVISGIESSSNGNLWISTFKGISMYDIKNNKFKNYDVKKGLLSNMFNHGSYYKNNKGEIFFGGINGINYFNGDIFKESNIVAPVLLSSLTIFKDNDKKELDISSVNEIELNHDDNFLKFDFASLDFTNPQLNKYAYMLEGLDNNWIQNENNNSVTYRALDPGNYTFIVKATNSDEVWNENSAEIRIKILPPFWKTWWFYSLVALFLIVTLILVHRVRMKMRIKKYIEIEKVKEKERELMREQAARDYHDELGHKLTRISLYSRRINKKLRPTANGLTEDLNNIVETTNSLQSGAKDLIWAMNPHEDSLYDMAVRLKDFGNELFEGMEINFACEGVDDRLKTIMLSMNSKRHLIYIFKEGMNNALKYSNCTQINLKFELEGNTLMIILSDNGIGFNAGSIQKGYGLKNISSRAKQINALAIITSNINIGTEINLKVPVSKINVKAE